MAKQGMKRPDVGYMDSPRNDFPPVPEIQGKAKKTKQRAKKETLREQEKS